MLRLAQKPSEKPRRYDPKLRPALRLNVFVPVSRLRFTQQADEHQMSDASGGARFHSKRIPDSQGPKVGTAIVADRNLVGGIRLFAFS